MEPHHVDLTALALVAVGIFLGGVAYLGWSGGALGHGAMSLLELIGGRLAYVAPVALVVAGGCLLSRDIRPPARPLRAGTLCLSVALTLAFAAGTLGLGPGTTPAAHFWSAGTLRARGGVLGGMEFWVAKHLLSTGGADVLAVFLLIAGVILLSGATFASVVMASRRHATAALRHTDIRSATRRAEAMAARARVSRASGPRDHGHDAAADFDPYDSGDSGPDAFIDFDPAAEQVNLVPEFTAGRIGDGDSADPSVTAYRAEEDQIDAAADEVTDVAAGVTAEFDVVQPDDPQPEDDVPFPSDEIDEVDDDLGPVFPAEEETGVGGPRRAVDASELTPAGRYRASVTDDPHFVWRRPNARFLTRSTGEAAKPDTAGQAQTEAALIEALGHFGVEAKVVGRVTGPHITRYEIRLAPGIKVSKVANLKDDLAYALAATDIRILAPIPGKTAVGVEVPNARRRIVHLGDVYQEPPEGWSPITVWLGKDISGKAVGADLAKMPHLLVAGTTGAGKSACVNAMLSSILMRATPHEVRLVLVDPKQVELNHYESIPHLLTPVITSPRMAANALQNLVKEMEQRYSIMSLARTRSLPELNKARAERGQPPLPYILCVIDELADLMMVAPADVEDSIIRLAQKARAVGIHLVLATQSPRVDVITGMIKANVPSRIAFAVSSQTDSRVILDQGGAESLLGQGDMLFSPVGTNKLQRIQGAYIDEAQIATLTEGWRKQGEPELREDLLDEVEEEAPTKSEEDDGFDPDEDPLLEEAIGLVAQMGTASTSMLQRRLRLGYTRAGRLIDMLERRGIISGYEGSKPRQVLITEADLPRVLVALAQGKNGTQPSGAGSGAPAELPQPDAGPDSVTEPPV
jgi:S-DNA-T family DNA segregation ATPase FtsK/SpoIIIE